MMLILNIIKKQIKKINDWFDCEVFIDLNGFDNIQTNNYTLTLIILTILTIFSFMK